MKIDFSVIGKRIRKIRKENGITQTELASQINVSTNHLGNIETGHKNPSAEMLINIAAALGVTVDSLLIEIDFPRKESDILDVFKDCDQKEIAVLKELIKSMKPILRKYKD